MSNCKKQFGSYDVFVAPGSRDDRNSGTIDHPYGDIQRALLGLRATRMKNVIPGPVTMWLRGGTYAIDQPIVFESEDSFPLTMAAYPGEKPVIDGGRPIKEFKEAVVNGVSCYAASIPEVKRGEWYFKSLFVNGKRKKVASLPKNDFYWIEDVPGTPIPAQLFDGNNKFISKKGDMKSFKNLTDVMIHVYHYWIDEYMPVISYDEETDLVLSSHYSIFSLTDDFKPRYAKYTIDNVLDGLQDPGDWYLDRQDGMLYYVPEEGETIDSMEVFAPITDQLVVMNGDYENNKTINDITFDGITFQHADWNIRQDDDGHFKPQHTDRQYASAPQACSNLPGAINMKGTKRITFTNCTIRHIGYYAINIWFGSENVNIVGNVIHDMGAGGIKINGGSSFDSVASRTRNIIVSDNDITTGGRVYQAGIGVILMNGCVVKIAHNHIYDFFYSGVSCGWVWGYTDSVCHSVIVEKNHIHKLGQKLLSDMGGVYTLGLMPHSYIRNNLIHDVEKSNYGGWAIYNDEGSTNIIVENNICYNTTSNAYHEHYGCENIIRNNIWAFADEGIICLGCAEDHNSFNFTRNIVITRKQPVFTVGYKGTVENPGFYSDLNLFFDVDDNDVFMANNFRKPEEGHTFSEFRKFGLDMHSIVADPKCKDLENYDFTLAEDSPAFALGFKPIDMSDVGVRPEEKRGL